MGDCVEAVLNSPGFGTHLDKPPLHDRAIAQRCYADIHAALIEQWRTPDEVSRRGSQRGLPDDFPIEGVQCIETAIPATDKDDWSLCPTDGHGGHCCRAGYANGANTPFRGA